MIMSTVITITTKGQVEKRDPFIVVLFQSSPSSKSTSLSLPPFPSPKPHNIAYHHVLKGYLHPLCTFVPKSANPRSESSIALEFYEII